MLSRLKDYSIVYSFDRSGYKRHARSFSELNAAAFAGKHFLVTGGTRGIGAAVADTLLRFGAYVTVTARSDLDFKERFAGKQGIQFMALDLADFDKIAEVQFPLFDGVVLNAGGMPSQLDVVEDRFDTIFASQVAGHYLLARKLMAEGRLHHGASVHWVSSGGMYLQKLDLSDLSWQNRPYDKVKSYANAKRAQVVLNELMSLHFKNYIFSCSHPGWVGTDALKEALPAFSNKLKDRMRSPAEGADTILWCLGQGVRLKTGQFWFDRRPRKTTPFFWTRTSEHERKALWHMLEDLWEEVSARR
jgi:dehydrogenase/reductase SDR family protein 12